MNQVLALFVFGVSLAVTSAGIGGRLQKYRVKGEFFCQQDPAKAVGISVRLMEEDNLGPDDNMGETTTDANGRFSLSGQERELTNIDPELKVYHDCNDRDVTGGIKNMPCQRKWKLKLPDLYINGKNTTTEIDIGRINLEIILPSEERDCIH